MAQEKDNEQDRLIRENSEHIALNAEAIKRQTEALEKIRDHYYPPPAGACKRSILFLLKVLCIILAYAGGVEAMGWYWDLRTANAMAKQCAAVAKKLFLEEGNVASASQFYEQAIAYNSSAVEYRMMQSFMKGMTVVVDMFELGRPLTIEEQRRADEVLASATMYQVTNPENPMTHVLMAQALLARGEPEEAIASIERAIACDPENPAVHTSACAIYAFAGKFASARQQLELAAQLGANSFLLTYWRGTLALDDHDIESACRYLREAVAMKPRLAIVHAMLGWAMLDGQQPDLAAVKTSFKRALVANPQHKLALLGMAEVSEREGNFIVARMWLDKVLTNDPNCMNARLMRAKIGMKQNNHEAAISDLSAAIALAPFRADLYQLRAEAYAKAGDAAHAQADRATLEALGK